MYLEWVDGVFADSADTVEGRYVHRRVDQQGAGLPDPTEVWGSERPVRSVTLGDPTLGIVAKMDLVDMEDGFVVPVEYKRGSTPDNPERSWEPERVQLCAQALILRAQGYRCDRAVLYFAGSRERVDVPITEALVSRTVELLDNLRVSATAPGPPPPLVDSPKCLRCSLVGICLPDETTAVSAGVTPPGRIRLLYPERPDASPLYVTEPGARVGRSGERLVVRVGDRVLADMRLIDVSQVNVFGQIQVSTQLLQELFQRECPVLFFSHGGFFYGLAHGMASTAVRLRMAQFRTASDPNLAVMHARHVVRTKILNQRTLLRRNARGLPDAVVPQLRRLGQTALRAPSVQSLLGVEGAAASLYFEHFDRMLTGTVPAFHFAERNRRPPRDPVNAMLSLGYALLAKDVTVTAFAAGLDPYLGVFHQPGRARPAFALDVMEEFRPLVVDSVVVNLINRNSLAESAFVFSSGACSLTPDGRRRFIEAYEQRMETSVIHPVFGYRISYRRALEVQVRLLARALTGELPRYIGFLTR